MSAYTHDCPPDDCGPCGTLPPGFVRLRYFYGKRLGVIDFIDEQRYHAGKLRFHNQRLHGAGVLCGLAVGEFAPGELVLRVTKGAAIDECGREIVVGYDQCVDVGAWYAKWRTDHLADDPAWAPPLDADGRLPLCVALRFRECTSSPEPAPRDPCACDATGSDYGRVREEFELQLLVHDEAMTHAPPAIAPSHPDLDRALARAVGGADLTDRLRQLLGGACRDAEPGAWLVLTCFRVTLDASGEHVTGMGNYDAVATMLYSSALLEELVTRDLGATLEAGAWATGAPEVSGIRISATDTLELALTGPLVKPTAEAAAYEVRRLDAAGWAAPGASATAVYNPPAAGAPANITISVDAGFLATGKLYRLAVIQDPAEPIVDDQLRPLHPLRPSFHFQVITSGGGLAIGPAPYAAGTP